jgi:hypothetical protein
LDYVNVFQTEDAAWYITHARRKVTAQNRRYLDHSKRNVDYFMKYTLSMPYPLIIAYKLGPISLFDHFSASPLGGDGSQLHPMHMKHNGATRTLLRLIDGVFPIFDLIHS